MNWNNVLSFSKNGVEKKAVIAQDALTGGDAVLSGLDSQSIAMPYEKADEAAPAKRIEASQNNDIEDLDRLRNRAVIDGVSRVNGNYMIEAIEAYFAIKIAAASLITNFDQLDTIEKEVRSNVDKIQEIRSVSDGKINIFGILTLKFVFSALVCLSGFFVIFHTVSTSDYFNQSSEFVCFIISIGMGLVGVFNFFAKSTFLGSDQVDSPKLKLGLELLENLGMSIVVACLVTIIAGQSQPVSLGIALGLFTFFLCILGGKLLAGSATLLQNQWTLLVGNRRFRSDQNELIKMLRERNEGLKVKVRSITDDKQRSTRQYEQDLSTIRQIESLRNFHVKFYQHYFDLARSFKSELSPESLVAIQRSI